jgi:hypothetical protein
MPDWRDIHYLRNGTPRQQAAYQALQTLDILAILAPFDARLVGTIPLDVDIPSSDLDIICHAVDLADFAARLQAEFGQFPGFQMARKQRYGHAVLVCDFVYDGWPIQIYGSPTPVDEQRAWKHMLAEARLLAGGGNKAREAIRALKRAGLKTEPAFAHYFDLPGDPYEVLLSIAA